MWEKRALRLYWLLAAVVFGMGLFNSFSGHIRIGEPWNLAYAVGLGVGLAIAVVKLIRPGRF